MCCGFSLLTEQPSVEGNLTSDQRRVHSRNHSVWRKNVFWTWPDKMLISQHAWVTSLLNIYCDVAMIEVCLWSRKIRDSMGFWTGNRLRVDKVRLLFCAAFIIMKRVTGVTQYRQKKTKNKKTIKSMNSLQKRQEYIKGKSPLFIL